MIIVAGILRLAHGDLAKVRAEAEAVVAATRAEAGCIAYSFAEDIAEPDLVRIYEEWQSRDDLAAHGRSDHVAAWHKALAGVTIEARDLRVIEAGSVEPLD